MFITFDPLQSMKNRREGVFAPMDNKAVAHAATPEGMGDRADCRVRNGQGNFPVSPHF